MLIRKDRTMLLLALAGIGATAFFTFLVFFAAGFFSSSPHSGAHLGSSP